ncbi:MAG: 30S ribosomal protein S16 [Candidatus Hydrogenedentes bacterium]|nr:30S ribosomal protein S16 [Candidatus Hydrogenedentota bacterium]
MATSIRLRRGGRTHKPYYRIVVIDSRHRDRGPEIDSLGVYHPCARPEPISEVDVHKTLEWLNKGAQPSETAKSLLRKLGVMKHHAEGTKPEETVVAVKGGVVPDKGYNAAPPVKEKPAAVEAPAEEAAETEEAAAE